MSPRVSVLLTCYNNRRFIEEAIASVRAQTYTDWELLALDDGSTDGTREYLSQQEGIRSFFHEKNLGTYANLNFGIEQARGEFLAILNDDDYWAPQKLESQVAALESDGSVGMVHTGGAFVGPSGDRIEGEPLGFPWPKTREKDAWPELAAHNRVITSSALFRTSLARELGGFDPNFYGCGDWHMWLRIAESHSIVHIDKDLTFYRVHETNACHDHTKMESDSLRIRHWLAQREREFFEKRGRAVVPTLAHNAACLGSEFARAGRASEARACYGRSIQLQPQRWQTWLRWAATFLPQRAFRALK